MKLCIHDWEVFTTAPRLLKGIVYLLVYLLITSAFLSLGIAFLTLIYFCITFCILINLSHLEDTGNSLFSDFLYEDKMCIKCNKMVFAASVEYKRIDDAAKQKAIRNRNVKGLKKEYDKCRTMRLKA